jgi:hypothetical protein
MLQSPSADTIDVFGIVYDMRQHRVCMVQSEVGTAHLSVTSWGHHLQQQYIAIHQAVLCALDQMMVSNGSPTGGLYPKPVAVPTIPSLHVNTTLLAVGHNQLSGQRSAPVRAFAGAEVHQNPAFVEDDEGIAESGF